MNILEITTYKVGGVYTHVAEIVKRMKNDTIILTGSSKKSGYTKENNQMFFHIPVLIPIKDIYFINPPGSYKKIKKVIEERKIDLIHIHGPLFSFCKKIIKKSKKPIVFTTHYVIDFKGNKVLSFFYRKVIKYVTKKTAKKVDKIICVNKDYISTYTKWGVKKDKIVYIPNGIDTEKYSPGKSNIKNKLKCKNLVIFWGRLGYQKNIKMLIEAFKNIKTKDTKLVIIGKGPDINKLKNLSAGNKNIIFTGYLSDKKLLNYARGADIAVLPSRAESWGLVIGEAMACKLPVISSDVGMAKELLADNRGIVLKKETKEELADKIDYLLNNKDICKTMEEKSRKYIVKNYGWEKVVKKTEQIYKEVTEN